MKKVSFAMFLFSFYVVSAQVPDLLLASLQQNSTGPIPSYQQSVSNSTTGTSVTVTYPTGNAIVNGNMLIAQGEVNENTTFPTVTGWTKISEYSNSTSIVAYYRVADGTEGDAGNLTQVFTSNGSGTDFITFAIHVFTDAKTTGTPYEGLDHTLEANNTYTVPAITSTGPNRLAVALVNFPDNGIVDTDFTNYTNQYNQDYAAGIDSRVVLGTLNVASATTTSTDTIGASTQSPTRWGGVIAFFLLPN